MATRIEIVISVWCMAQKRQQAEQGHQQAQYWIQSHTSYFFFEDSKATDAFV